MRFLRLILPYRAAIAVVIDAVILGLLWHYIPDMDRPVEILSAAVVVLGVFTAAMFVNVYVHNFLVIVATLSATLFIFEICQKYSNFLNLAEVNPKRVAAAGSPARPRVVALGGESGRAYLFMGGAAAYGAGLGENETLAAAFAAVGDADVRVINLAKPDAGPNATLRELETGRELLAADLGGDKVAGIYYLLTDELPGLAANPDDRAAPRYVLEDGKSVYRGPFREPGPVSRFSYLLDRSRIYPLLRERLAAGFNPFAASYKWELTYALIEEMNRVCKERYSVPLTVVYWGDKAEPGLRIQLAGIRFIDAVSTLGKTWERNVAPNPGANLPTADANRELGRYLRTEADAAGRDDVAGSGRILDKQ